VQVGCSHFAFLKCVNATSFGDAPQPLAGLFAMTSCCDLVLCVTSYTGSSAYGRPGPNETDRCTAPAQPPSSDHPGDDISYSSAARR